MGRVINVGDKATEGKNFQAIPEGTRVVATVYAIDEVPVKSGPDAGKSQLDLTFKVQGGQYNGYEIRFQKIPLYENGASWKLVAFADALGWEREGKNVVLPDNLQSALGQPLTIKVSEAKPDAQGRIFNNVSGYAAASVGEADAAAASDDAAPSWGNLK